MDETYLKSPEMVNLNSGADTNNYVVLTSFEKASDAGAAGRRDEKQLAFAGKIDAHPRYKSNVSDVASIAITGAKITSSTAGVERAQSKHDDRVDLDEARKWIEQGDNDKAVGKPSYHKRLRQKRSDVRRRTLTGSPLVTPAASVGSLLTEILSETRKLNRMHSAGNQYIAGSPDVKPVATDKVGLVLAEQQETATNSDVYLTASENPKIKAFPVSLTPRASEFVKSNRSLKSESKDIIAGWGCQYQYSGAVDIKNNEDKLGVTVKGNEWGSSDFFKIRKFVRGEGDFSILVSYEKSENVDLKLSIPQEFKERCCDPLLPEETSKGSERTLLLTFNITQQTCIEIVVSTLGNITNEGFVKIKGVNIYYKDGTMDRRMESPKFVCGSFLTGDENDIDHYDQEIKVLPEVVNEGYEYKKECFYFFNEKTFLRNNLDEVGLSYAGIDGGCWRFSKLDEFYENRLDFKRFGIVYDENVDEFTAIEL